MTPRLRPLASLLAPVLALLVLAQPAASFAQPRPTFATAEQLAALKTQALWIDEIASRMEQRGKSIADADARELRLVNAELTRFDRVAKASGESGKTGVLRQDADELADRLAQLWLNVRTARAGLAEAAPAGPAPAPAPAPPPPATLRIVPQGTGITIQLGTWLSSKNAVVGDRFSAYLVEPILVDGQVAVPAGAIFEGLVTDVDRAGRVSDGGKLSLLVDRLRGDAGQIADTRGWVVGTGAGKDLKGKSVDLGSTAAGAAVGGVLGALLGGKEGALIGIGVGAGGALLADKGKEVDLPQGSYLRVELQAPVNVTWAWKPAV